MPNRIARAALAAALSSGLCASAALAHAVLERKEASPNAAYRGVVQIMHGCDGAATNRVSVTLPEGVIGAKPMPKPGWTLGTAKGAYAKAYQSFHGQVSEGVKTITWSGGSLPDDQADEFTFFARISGDFAPGSTVYFPVEQGCEPGSLSWSQVPEAGREAQNLKTPAPSVRIVAAAAPAPATAAAPAPATAGAATFQAGDVAIATPWLRATPGGAKVAGGYVSLTNTGKTADRLVGAAIPQAGEGEVHAMSMEGGVMKMAPLPDGLTIEPGQTVELKPGGNHLMFLGLKDGLKAGETVSGTLTFARAGTVPVTFSVAPIGAQSPGGATSAEPAGGHHH